MGARFLFSLLVLLAQIPTALAAPFVTPTWRLDAVAGADALPGNFRILRDLVASGSGQPTRTGLQSLAMRLRAVAGAQPIYLIDLRQESHGYLLTAAGKAYAVSWHTAMNAANRGRDATAVQQDEQQRLAEAVSTEVTASPMGRFDLASGMRPVTFRASAYETEEQAAAAAGFIPIRIAVTDMRWPEPAAIDAFLAFYDELPPDAWLHFHCQAGMGRTTTFLVLTELLRHPEVALSDALSHQLAAGGADLHLRPEIMTGLWLFAQYARERRAGAPRWSEWLARHDG